MLRLAGQEEGARVDMRADQLEPDVLQLRLPENLGLTCVEEGVWLLFVLLLMVLGRERLARPFVELDLERFDDAVRFGVAEANAGAAFWKIGL